MYLAEPRLKNFAIFIKIIFNYTYNVQQESVINAQINPELNRRWAEDLEKGEVDREIELIISRSRQNSIVNQLKETRCGFDVNFDVEPGTEAASEEPVPTGRVRSNSLAAIRELPHLGSRTQNRTRTISYSPQVCTLWIGH